MPLQLKFFSYKMILTVNFSPASSGFKVFPGFGGIPALSLLISVYVMVALTICLPAVGLMGHVCMMLLSDGPEHVSVAVKTW